MAVWGTEEAATIRDIAFDRIGDKLHLSWGTPARSLTVYEIRGSGTQKVDEALRWLHRVVVDVPSEGMLQFRLKVATHDGVTLRSPWVEVPEDPG